MTDDRSLVTSEIVERFRREFDTIDGSSSWAAGVRSALEAVAADIAQAARRDERRKCAAAVRVIVRLDDDGTVVVQGELVDEPKDILYEGRLPTGRVEARVRIPVDVLRQAVLSQALAYTFDLDGKPWTVPPDDCKVVFPADATASSTSTTSAPTRTDSGWIRHDEPARHVCQPPRNPAPGMPQDAVGEIGALWRCGCGRLWQVVHACPCGGVIERHGGRGMHSVGRDWAEASWRQRWRNRRWA